MNIMKKRIVRSLGLVLAFAIALPIKATEKQEPSWKKPLQYAYQAAKIATGIFVLYNYHQGDVKYKNMSEGFKFFRNTPILQRQRGYTIENYFNNKIPYCYTPKKPSWVERYVPKTEWDTVTMRDLENRYASTVFIVLTNVTTGLGLIISGIKEMYNEYNKPELKGNKQAEFVENNTEYIN